MADVIAYLLEGPSDWGGGAPWMRETETGWVGHKDYWAQTTDLLKAKLAVGAPRRGDPWSAEAPSLKVVSVEVRYVGGAINIADQTGGVCSLSIDYSTPSAGGRLPVPEYGKSYTLVRPSIGTVQRYADIRREFKPNFDAGDFNAVVPPGWTFPTTEQIAGGRGTAAAIGTTALEVSTWRRTRDIDRKRLVTLQRYQMVNEDRVSTPVFLDDTDFWTFEPGELQFKTFQIDSDRGFTRLTMTMEMSEDFWLRQVAENQFGEVLDEDPTLFVMYPAAKFVGLW